MSKWWENRWLELVCRLLVGGVFVYASLDKILHPVVFAKVVYNYQMFPVPLSNLLAMILPWLELFAGLALIVGVLVTESALLTSGLLAVFIFAPGPLMLQAKYPNRWAVLAMHPARVEHHD